MPLKKCTSGGKPGWKWGDNGKCYTYNEGDARSEKNAKRRAIRQGKAIKVNKGK